MMSSRFSASRSRITADSPEIVAALVEAARHGASTPGGPYAPALIFDPRTAVDLAHILCALRGDKHYAALAATARVTVYADLRPVIVKAEVAALAGLAFCKLFHSALIHAFPYGWAGHIGIHLWPVATLPGVRANLLIADDGQGFDDEPTAEASSGIPVARHCVERCGGTLTREAGSGTVWRIMLPR